MKWILIALLIGCTPAVVSGTDGIDGSDGEPGKVGPIGEPGADGSDGIDGATAAIGETGPAGPQGQQGIEGPQGAPGSDGANGAPGWILRDMDGNVIDYEVTPGMGEMFTASNCVRIISDDQRRSIGMEFNLVSGDPQTCYPSMSTWQTDGMKFRDIDCSGDRYTDEYGPGSIVSFIGAMYYPSLPYVAVSSYYQWDSVQGGCRSKQGPIQLFKYELVPTEILDLMPDAPYSLEWE